MNLTYEEIPSEFYAIKKHYVLISHCGGKEICRLCDPPQAECFASETLFYCIGECRNKSGECMNTKVVVNKKNKKSILVILLVFQVLAI